ncbi:hypothetical protein ABE10_00435, partial [Bacillus toyonensis]|nr:hypothetical protein [Bacillus toyonensis]
HPSRSPLPDQPAAPQPAADDQEDDAEREADEDVPARDVRRQDIGDDRDETEETERAVDDRAVLAAPVADHARAAGVVHRQGRDPGQDEEHRHHRVVERVEAGDARRLKAAEPEELRAEDDQQDDQEVADPEPAGILDLPVGPHPGDFSSYTRPSFRRHRNPPLRLDDDDCETAALIETSTGQGSPRNRISAVVALRCAVVAARGCGRDVGIIPIAGLLSDTGDRRRLSSFIPVVFLSGPTAGSLKYPAPGVACPPPNGIGGREPLRTGVSPPRDRCHVAIDGARPGR